MSVPPTYVPKTILVCVMGTRAVTLINGTITFTATMQFILYQICSSELLGFICRFFAFIYFAVAEKGSYEKKKNRTENHFQGSPSLSLMTCPLY